MVMSRSAGTVSSTGLLGGPEHPHVGELGRPPGDRVAERELALLHQHQGRHRGDRLGHRGDAEQGVPLHRQVSCEVALAAQGDLDDLALAPDQGHAAGEIAGVDRALQHVGGVLEARHIEAAHRDRAVVHRRLSLKRRQHIAGKGGAVELFPGHQVESTPHDDHAPRRDDEHELSAIAQHGVTARQEAPGPGRTARTGRRSPAFPLRRRLRAGRRRAWRRSGSSPPAAAVRRSRPHRRDRAGRAGQGLARWSTPGWRG